MRFLESDGDRGAGVREEGNGMGGDGMRAARVCIYII